MTYKETLDYIHSVTWKGSRPGLERITELLEKLNNPQDGLKFIHIAGTNGKGSTSAMLESVLRAVGYRTGLFVSPYIKHFNERICVSGKPISNEDLAAVTSLVRPFADAMADAPTEFELITAIGLVHFLREKCDVVVLETGMGGRLDSTNVIKTPLCSVITGIAMDHTAFLGDTVEKIAVEKAGIIKDGCPVVWGGHDKAARAVIESHAAAHGSRFIAAEDTPMTVREMTFNGTLADYGEHAGVRIPLLGTYQPQNLATVLSVLDALRADGMDISERAVYAGLATVRWRGRFEKLCDTPLIFSDGAHNPEGIAAAAKGIAHYFEGRRVALISGVMADKDYTDMVRTLAPLTERVFTLTPDNPRSLPATEYAAVFAHEGIPASAHESVADAVHAAVAYARETDTPIFSLGSLYMYAEVTAVLEEMGLIPLDI